MIPKEATPLLVTARLASPLAGDAPRLDSLLEAVIYRHTQKPQSAAKVDRSRPLPDGPPIPIPIFRRKINGWTVAVCSMPILPVPDAEGVDHYNKKLDVDAALLLRPESRVNIPVSGGPLKSYRLPLRVRSVPMVRWFAHGNRKSVRSALKHIDAIGSKTAIGYGRVAGWDVETIADDLSWFAPSPHGPVLMTTLPIGPDLPGDLVGYQRSFGACQGPYWHADRFTEIVWPC